MPNTVASRNVTAFGLSSKSRSASHLVRPYSEIGSSGVSSVQRAAPVVAPYPLFVFGNTTSWFGLRSLFSSFTDSKLTVFAVSGSRSHADAPHHPGQVNHRVRVLERGAHGRFVADVALDEVERRVGAQVEHPLPGPVGEVVEGGDVVPGREQVLARDAAEVPEPAGDQDALAHVSDSPCRGRRV
jgi:hypothetical protein